MSSFTGLDNEAKSEAREDAEAGVMGLAAGEAETEDAGAAREGSLAEIERAYGGGDAGAGEGAAGADGPGWTMHGFGPEMAAGPQVGGAQAMFHPGPSGGGAAAVPSLKPDPTKVDEITSTHKNPATARKLAQARLNTTQGRKAGRFAHVAGGGYRTVYRGGGFDALVFLPDGGLASGNAVDVFLFFHGWGGQFGDNSVSTWTQPADKVKPGESPAHTTLENPAAQSDMAQAITSAGRNVIGIMPMKVAEDPRIAWGAGKYKALVDGVVKDVGTQLGAPSLQPGNVSLAGHSAGGGAVGFAAGEDKDRVSDVTIQDGTYNWASYGELREWFLLGKGPKTLRVIAAGDPAKKHGGERSALQEKLPPKKKGQPSPGPGGLHELAIKAHIEELKAKGTLKHDLKVNTVFDATTQVDATPHAPGIVLEKKIEVTGPAGLQGTMMIFGMPNASHFDVRNDTMADVVAAGASADDKLIGKP